MYIAIVVLTMLVLPIGSIAVEHVWHSGAPLPMLAGRWFVFWSVGVRLGLAGMRQVVQPRFTAQNIFHLDGDGALPLVRELGVANAGTALIGFLSIVIPSFVLPASISAGLFFAVAGFTHLGERDRSRNENVAMISDFWAAAILIGYVAACTLIR